MKNALTRFIKKEKILYNDRYPRKVLDEFLEFLRFIKVEPYIRKGATLLDVGTGDGSFLHYLNGYVQAAVGIDSHLTQIMEFGTCRLVPGYFPHDFVESRTFDVITMLAVVEHIPMNLLPEVVDACWDYLNPSGQVIITVPHPRVDRLLNLLKALRIVEGFSMQEHYGFDPEELPALFSRWKLVKRERWALGCNNLFIFEKFP